MEQHKNWIVIECQIDQDQAKEVESKIHSNCRNFSLGLVTKVRARKGAGKSEAWESHLMLLGVLESVREWTPTLPS